MTTLPQPTGEVHPLADLWPMMQPDELAALAEDIKEQGLIHPIILDSDGVLVDGRNRLAACQLAGVEPVYASLNGHDPVAYIASANANRRQSSKGQLALWAAAANERLAANQGQREIAALVGVSQAAIAQARAVLRHEDLTATVRDGARSLYGCYQEAIKRKEEADSDASKLAVLREEAPDLAEQVESERLSLGEAMGALRVRRDEERKRAADAQQQRMILTRQLTENLHWLLTLLSTREWRERVERDYDREVPGTQMKVTKEALKQASGNLSALSEEWTRED